MWVRGGGGVADDGGVAVGSGVSEPVDFGSGCERSGAGEGDGATVSDAGALWSGSAVLDAGVAVVDCADGGVDV